MSLLGANDFTNYPQVPVYIACINALIEVAIRH